MVGRVLQTTYECYMPLIPFPVGIGVHNIAQHLGCFRPAIGIKVAEYGVKIHFDSPFRGDGDSMAALFKVCIG